MSKEFDPKDCENKLEDLADVLKRADTRAKIMDRLLWSPPACAYGGPISYQDVHFDVVIIGCEDSRFMEALKELRNMFPNMGLIEAKNKLKRCEPIVIYEGRLEELAKRDRTELEKFGFKVELK